MRAFSLQKQWCQQRRCALYRFMIYILMYFVFSVRAVRVSLLWQWLRHRADQQGHHLIHVMRDKAPKRRQRCTENARVPRIRNKTKDTGVWEGDRLQPSQLSCPSFLTSKTFICFNRASAHKKLYQFWSLQMHKNIAMVADTGHLSRQRPVSSSRLCKTMEEKGQDETLNNLPHVKAASQFLLVKYYPN